jgi:hypothetical protein
MIGGGAWILLLSLVGYLGWNWPIAVLIGGGILSLLCATLGLVFRRYGWWIAAAGVVLILYTILLLEKRPFLEPSEVLFVGGTLWLCLELAGVWCSMPTDRFALSAFWSLLRSLGWRMLLTMSVMSGFLLVAWGSTGMWEGGMWVFLLRILSGLIILAGICGLFYSKRSP